MTPARSSALAALGLLACSGCVAAGPPYEARTAATPFAPTPILFDSTTSPLSYQAPAPADVGRAPAYQQVFGESCQQGLAFPFYLVGIVGGEQPISSPWGIGWGDDGFAKAVEQAQAQAGNGRLFDVRADLRTTSVLGIWRRRCLEVHAAVAR